MNSTWRWIIVDKVDNERYKNVFAYFIYSKTIQVIFFKRTMLVLQHVAKKKWNHFLWSRIHWNSKVWVWDPINLRQAMSESWPGWHLQTPKAGSGLQRLTPFHAAATSCVILHRKLTHLLAVFSPCHSWFPRWLLDSFTVLCCPQVKTRQAPSLKTPEMAQRRLAFQRKW